MFFIILTISNCGYNSKNKLDKLLELHSEFMDKTNEAYDLMFDYTDFLHKYNELQKELDLEQGYNPFKWNEERVDIITKDAINNANKMIELAIKIEDIFIEMKPILEEEAKYVNYIKDRNNKDIARKLLDTSNKSLECHIILSGIRKDFSNNLRISAETRILFLKDEISFTEYSERLTDISNNITKIVSNMNEKSEECTYLSKESLNLYNQLK